ncbi:MAG: T9SS type A sorting domain-containing protein [Saprospiraceae bacterium]|nr:T9SS type A sorting domain-containing protein [Candidatus Defluviibacterium haderslevense]MBK7242506.1 T9SS type A sorting domain-containing protein [Candidatus Defluviibacterium haderslevense]
MKTLNKLILKPIILNIYLFILFSISNIFAQKYTPLQLINYSPLWTHLHNIDRIPIKEGNWIFLEQNFDRDPFLIDEGVLYNVYNIVAGAAWRGGYYIEAIDINTGNLIWDNEYYSETIGERRFAQQPVIHGDTLELLINEEYDNLDTFFKPIWFASFPRRISFNKNTGNILNTTFSIPKDPNARKLPVPFPYGPTHLYYQDTEFIVINHLPLTDTITGKSSIWYNRIVLDQHGKEIGNTELYIPTNYFKIQDVLNDFENNNSFCFYSSETHPDSAKRDFEIGYHYMDRNMQVQTSGQLNTLNTGKENTFGPAYVSANYFIIRSDTFVENPYYYKYKYLTLFNRIGSQIEKLDLRSLNFSTNNLSFLQPTLINTKTGPMILFSVFTRTNNTLDFYLSDGNGGIKKTKSFKIKPETKTEISLLKIQYVGDNVLCYFIYRETATRLNEPPLWSSWIMIKGEDLGLLSTTKDLSLDPENTLKISPNPVSDLLKIEFDEIVSGKFSIFNNIGQLNFSKEIEQTKEFNYNVSHLLNGKYNIQFITNNKVLNAQFIKVK